MISLKKSLDYLNHKSGLKYLFYVRICAYVNFAFLVERMFFNRGEYVIFYLCQTKTNVGKCFKVVLSDSPMCGKMVFCKKKTVSLS